MSFTDPHGGLMYTKGGGGQHEVQKLLFRPVVVALECENISMVYIYSQPISSGLLYSLESSFSSRKEAGKDTVRKP